MATQPEQPITIRIPAHELRAGDVIFHGPRQRGLLTGRATRTVGDGTLDRLTGDVTYEDDKGTFTVRADTLVVLSSRRTPCVGCRRVIIVNPGVPDEDIRCNSCGYEYLVENLRRMG